MRDRIKDLLLESIQVKEDLLRTRIDNIIDIASLIIESLKKNGKVILFGNGGSASDSQHIAAELVGRFKRDRSALAGIALTTNTSILTSLANDYGYDVVFSRQVEALGKKNAAALQRIFEKGQKLSGMGEADLEDFTNGLKENPFGGSLIA